MDREEYKYLIYGLRKELGLSHEKLGKLVSIRRRDIGKYEEGIRIPSERRINQIKEIVDKKGFNLHDLVERGYKSFREVTEREKSKILRLESSEDLAELIGILLGDGCMQKDGLILVTFDAENDESFIQRRVKTLIHSLIKAKTTIKVKEGTKTGMLTLYFKPFIKFLEHECQMIPGDKIINQTTIPAWCFNNPFYLSACLRGIFDTDGSFKRNGTTPIVEFRFSIKAQQLIGDVSKALERLQIKHTITTSGEGASIRMQSKEAVLKFFKGIGSSNIKHITRFLLWRANEIQTNIQDVGLSSLSKRVTEIFQVSPHSLDLPFMWDECNGDFQKHIREDIKFCEWSNVKRGYNWKDIVGELIRAQENEVAKALNMRVQNVRCWARGTKNPSIKMIPKLLDIACERGITLNEYKR